MGRPPIGKVAMTSTERVHRFRAKHRKPVTEKVTITRDEAAEIVAWWEELAQARKRIAELEGEADKSDDATARSARLSKRDVQFTATLYDLLSTYATATNRRARRGRPPRAARKRKTRGHR